MLIDIDKELEYYGEICKKINEDCCNNINDCFKCKRLYRSQWCPINTVKEFILLLEKIKRDKEEVDKIIENRKEVIL